MALCSLRFRLWDYLVVCWLQVVAVAPETFVLVVLVVD
jgi:hypothetical protein